jgi:N-acetylglucosaminyl-diphospho-decaprenol L-rhamnosyltransferase
LLNGDIAWVKGAAMIARKDVILDVGGVDEVFFLYAEETDLCLRIRKAGWEIGFIDDAGGHSLGRAKRKAESAGSRLGKKI